MRLIAKKPCKFGGRKFLIGEEIPKELVANPKAQEKMEVISIATDDEEKSNGLITIPIHSEQGELVIEITNEELNVFTDIRQIGVSSTEDKQKITELIQNINSMDLLILIDSLDERKHVKKEAQARAKDLSE